MGVLRDIFLSSIVILMLIGISSCTIHVCSKTKSNYDQKMAVIEKAEQLQREAKSVSSLTQKGGESDDDVASQTDKRKKIIREFAMEEMPSVWEVLQRLKAEYERLSYGMKNVKMLQKELEEAGDICMQRQLEEQIQAIKTDISAIEGTIEDAYIATRKSVLLPDHERFAAIKSDIVQRGLQSATLLAAKYGNLCEK